MKKLLLRSAALLIALASMISALSGCTIFETKVNGVDIGEYTIVVDKDGLDYNIRAAEYIQSEVEARTGKQLVIVDDSAEKSANEIVVGETSRAISAELEADTEGLQFSLFADKDSIALEGDYFIIAAAAYFFVDQYVTGFSFSTDVPREVKVHDPIVREAKNFVFLIGDGMGVYQTQLFTQFDTPEGEGAYNDGEDFFYGYLFPYLGMARTQSLDGVTDSAAGGTALASGYKTHNAFIGRDGNGNDVKLLTELAASLGKATAVMSTETKTGATPSAFSAHAEDRGSSASITASQLATQEKYGTIINCGIGNENYTPKGIEKLEKNISDTLSKLSEDRDGFFVMYEEAHIDKHCHNNDMEATFNAVMRFNQAIARFMEYAFYNPDTLVLITADHETGGIVEDEDGAYHYTLDDHSANDVRVFAYGHGMEVFNGVTVENVQIPKTLADYMGVDNFGDPNGTEFPSLAK